MIWIHKIKRNSKPQDQPRDCEVNISVTATCSWSNLTSATAPAPIQRSPRRTWWGLPLSLLISSSSASSWRTNLVRSPRPFLHLSSLLLPLFHPHLPLLKMILKVFFHLVQPNSHSITLCRVFLLQSFLLCMQVLEIVRWDLESGFQCKKWGVKSYFAASV